MNLKTTTLVIATVGCTLLVATPSFAGQFAQNHPRRAQVLRRDNHLNNAINRDRGQLGGNYGALKTEQRGIRQQEQQDARADGGHITQQQQQQLNGEENTLRSQVRQDYTGQGSAFGRGYGRGGGAGAGGWGGGRPGGGQPGGGFGGGNPGGGVGYGGGNSGGSGQPGGGWGGGGGGGGTFAQKHPRRAEVLGRDNNLNNAINQDRGQLGGNYQALKTDDRSIRQQEQADARANGGYITGTQKQQLNQEENQLRQQIGQDYTGAR